MKCSVCLATSKFACECGLEFCKTHGLAHSKDLRHILEESKSFQNKLNEIYKKISTICNLQRKMCQGVADFFKDVEEISQSIYQRLESIKTNFFRIINEKNVDQYEFEDIKDPSLEDTRELLYKAYENIRLVFEKVENTKKELTHDGPSLDEYQNDVNDIAETSDNNFIVSGSWDKTVRIWNNKTKLQVAVMEGHSEAVTSVAVASDNSFIVSGSKDWTVRIWNFKTRRQESVLEGHKNSVRAVAVSGDNNFVVSGSLDSTIRIWNLKTRCQDSVLEGHTAYVWCVAVTNDNKFIVSGGCDKTVRIWNLKTRCQEAVLEGHSDSVWKVAATIDNNFIVSGSCDQTVRIWNLKTKLQEQVFTSKASGNNWISAYPESISVFKLLPSM